MLLLTLFALSAWTPAPATQQPKPANLQAVLALSIDPGFQDEWFHTASEHGLRVKSVSKVVCRQQFEVYVFAVGYATGPKGRTDLRYDVKITRPDGESYFEEKGLELCVAEGMPEQNVQLAKQGVAVSFDPPDPKGEYLVQVKLHDAIAKNTSATEGKISLVEIPEARGFKDEEEFEAWMEGYYMAAEPTRAIEAIAFTAEAGLLGGKEPSAGVRSFLRTVCSGNKFLEPFLLERFPKLNHAARVAALDVLADAGYDKASFLAAASEDERKEFGARAKTAPRDPLTGTILSEDQLQEIWGMFYATGAYAPIERVAKSLVFDEREVQEVGDQKSVERGENLVDWSLGSNLESERVREYCKWMLAHERLDKPDAAALKKLLKL